MVRKGQTKWKDFLIGMGLFLIISLGYYLYVFFEL